MLMMSHSGGTFWSQTGHTMLSTVRRLRSQYALLTLARTLLTLHGTVHRPFWQLSPLVSMRDAYYKTPLLDAADIPARSPDYTTTVAYTRLLELGVVPAPSPKHWKNCLLRNIRGPIEIKRAKRDGRFLDYERMKIFNESEVKAD